MSRIINVDVVKVIRAGVDLHGVKPTVKHRSWIHYD